MNRRWIAMTLLISVSFVVHPAFAAETPEDAKISSWLMSIEKLSEKGAYARVQHDREELADYAYQTKRFEVAARQYELLLAARPRRAERVKLSTRLGHVRMVLKDYVRAIAAYEDAVHDDAKDWEANLSLARAFSAADLNQRALQAYRRCMDLRPREAAPYEEIAGVYQKQGFLTKAIGFYEQALARDPKPTIYLQMADCYAHQKNMTKAIEILGQAKSRLPGADYDVRLGEIYQRLGDIKLATQAWEEALKTDTRRDDVRLRLTLLYEQAGRRIDTDRLIKGLVSAYPTSPLVHHTKAMILFQRGNVAGAKAEALIAQQLSPTELVAHFNDLLLLEIRNPS